MSSQKAGFSFICIFFSHIHFHSFYAIQEEVAFCYTFIGIVPYITDSSSACGLYNASG